MSSGSLSDCLTGASIDIDDVGIIIGQHIGTQQWGTYEDNNFEDLEAWLDGGGVLYHVIWEHTNGCCGGSTTMTQIQPLFNTWLGTGHGLAGVNGYEGRVLHTFADLSLVSGTTLDYSGLSGKKYYTNASGGINIPSVCNSLANGGGSGNSVFFVCDPGRTGSAGTFVGVADVNSFQLGSSSDGGSENRDIMNWITGLGTGTATTSSYNLFQDQVTLAGRVYTDTMLSDYYTNYALGPKQIFAFAIIPIEYFAASGTTNDYFYPNFIPTNVWSYGDVGVDYCAAAQQNSCSSNYWLAYEWASYALDSNLVLGSNRFVNSVNYIPEGQSLWWQVINTSGVGVGLWAQISFKDSYDGASGSTTRDDQESLLNVVISNVDYRKNDTTRYSAGDTGMGMDGYHYWSYQGATNADNDGLGINYGTSPIECASSNDSGCFWADAGTDHPRAAMVTSSDPYKSGNMSLSVNYNSNTDTFSTGSFDAAIIQQNITRANPGGTYPSQTIANFRKSSFYTSSASSYSGFFSGILEFDVSGSGNSQLASMRSSSTLASFTFDTTNDDVQVVAPMTIGAAPANNYTANWTTVDTGSMTLKFGDATNDEAKSAYLSSEVFGAEIQDDGAQIDGTSGGSNNLAGVMVSYNTLDTEDSDLFHSGGNDSMPDTAYSTWGFWAMSSVDISPNTGYSKCFCSFRYLGGRRNFSAK